MKRRRFIKNFSVASTMLITPGRYFSGLPAKNDLTRNDFYVGTYGTGESGGIYFCRLNTKTGEIILRQKIVGIDNPSYLTINKENHFLYAVNEVTETNGNPGGAVSSFAIDPENGSLRYLNRQLTIGGSPCFISIDHTGRFVLLANYSGGNVTILPVLKDGKLGEHVESVQHKGQSINPDRQGSPHPHSIIVSADNQFVFVPDLGLDKILIYRFDQNKGTLRPNDTPHVSLKPGAGPRHFTFHPNGKFAYVINELNSTITAFSYESQKGELKGIQIITTLPEDYTGRNYCADIHVHPTGNFLYGSNRGHNSIAIFTIGQETGILTRTDHEQTQGEFPRNFAVEPLGKFLLVANQRSNNIVSFRIDTETGVLIPAGHTIEIPEPVCVKFLN
jgi:6-phosphogluconolactonase